MANSGVGSARKIGNTMPIIPNTNISSNKAASVRTANLTQLHNSAGLSISAEASFVAANTAIIQNGLSAVTLGGQGATFNVNDTSINIDLKYNETEGRWFLLNNSDRDGIEIIRSANDGQTIASDAWKKEWLPIERGDIIKFGDQQITFDLLPPKCGGEMHDRSLINEPAISSQRLIKAIPEIAGRMGQFFVDTNATALKFKPNSEIDKLVPKNDPIRARIREYIKNGQTQAGYSVRNGDLSHKGDDYVYLGGSIVISGKDYQVFGLFDGISQYGKGRFASKDAAKYINEFIHSDQAGKIATPEELLKSALAYAHDKLTQKNYFSGTTAVVLLVDEINGKGHVGHVGDSRLYAVNEAGTAECLTEDHDLYNVLKREMAEKGEEIPPKEVFGNLAAAIGRALGFMQSKMNVPYPTGEGPRLEFMDSTPDIASFDLKGISKLILGSDGLPNLAGENSPISLKEKSAQKLAQDLTALARNTEKYDDASAVVVNVMKAKPHWDLELARPIKEIIDWLKENPGKAITIGRSSKCDVTIEISAVTRQHAEIKYENGYFWARDLGSTFGTYKNGELLPKGTGRETDAWTEFKDDDVLSLANDGPNKISLLSYCLSTGDWKNPLAQTNANEGQFNDSGSPRAIAGVVQPIVDRQKQHDQEQDRKDDERRQIEKQMNELLARMSQAAAGIDISKVTLKEIQFLYDQFNEHVKKMFPLLKGDRLAVALKIVFQSLGINSWHQVGLYSSTSVQNGYQQTIDRNGAWISFRIGGTWHIVDPYTGIIGNYTELSCRPKEINNRDTLSYEDLFAPPKIL